MQIPLDKVSFDFPKRFCIVKLNRKILEIHHTNHRFTRKSNDDIYDRA